MSLLQLISEVTFLSAASRPLLIDMVLSALNVIKVITTRVLFTCFNLKSRQLPNFAPAIGVHKRTLTWLIVLWVWSITRTLCRWETAQVSRAHVTGARKQCAAQRIEKSLIGLLMLKQLRVKRTSKCFSMDHEVSMTFGGVLINALSLECLRKLKRRISQTDMGSESAARIFFGFNAELKGKRANLKRICLYIELSLVLSKQLYSNTCLLQTLIEKFPRRF